MFRFTFVLTSLFAIGCVDTRESRTDQALAVAPPPPPTQPHHGDGRPAPGPYVPCFECHQPYPTPSYPPRPPLPPGAPKPMPQLPPQCLGCHPMPGPNPIDPHWPNGPMPGVDPPPLPGGGNGPGYCANCHVIIEPDPDTSTVRL